MNETVLGSYFSTVKLVLLMFSLLCGYVSQGQIRIVHDPIACGYGLKNEQNKWTLPPHFQEINCLQGKFFACKQNEKWGLYLSNGNKLLSPEYDAISWWDQGQFYAQKQKSNDRYTERYCGILDTSGQWTLPCSYSSIQRLPRYEYLVVRASYALSGISYESSIMDRSGKPTMPFVPGFILPLQGESQNLLVADKMISTFTMSGNVHIVNRKGEKLSSSSYDIGLPCTDYVVVSKNQKLGAIDLEGVEKVAPIYQLANPNYEYHNPLPCIHGHHEFLFKENDLLGMFNAQWKTVIPARYKSLKPINSNFSQSTDAAYIGQTGVHPKMHLIDKQGKILFEADTILVMAIEKKKASYYDPSTYHVYFIFQNAAKWGLADKNGKAILTEKYDQILFTDQQQIVCIQEHSTIHDKPSLLSIEMAELDSLPVGLEELKRLQRIDSVELFTRNGQLFPLVYNTHQNIWQIGLISGMMPVNLGKFVMIRGHNSGYILDKKGQLVLKTNFINAQNGRFPLVQYDGNVNLWHPLKGKLLEDGLRSVNQQFLEHNLLWGQKKNGKWHVYDSTGLQRSPIGFDAISYQLDTFVVQLDGKKGLVDASFNWIIPPSFKEIQLLSNRSYLFTTFHGHCGLANVRKVFKMDTTYTQCRTVVSMPSRNRFYYELSNARTSLIVDPYVKPVGATMKELITQHWYEPETVVHLEVDDEQRTRMAAYELTNEIYRILAPWIEAKLSAFNGSFVAGQMVTYNQHATQLKVEHVTEKTISLSVYTISYNNMDVTENEKFDRELNAGEAYSTENYIFQRDKWRKIELEELFNKNSAAFQEQVVESIQRTPGLHIDCTQPGYLFDQIYTISLNKEGVKLYFNQGPSREFQVLLTKDQIQKIPGSTWVLAFL
jgi:hypothetical protein